MPLLSIETNQKIEQPEALLPELSKELSKILGKSEAYIMVKLKGEQAIYFSSSSDPCAYIELKSLGLPENNTADLSFALCELMEKKLGIPSHRVYIEFANPPRHLWGWDKGTFA